MNTDEIREIFRTRRSTNKSNFMNGCSSVMIYGAGNCGKDVYLLLRSIKISVSCFLDQNGSNEATYSGVPVIKATDERITEEQKANALIIIAVFNPHADTLAIISDLKSLGYNKLITFVELYEMFPKFFGSRFWLSSLDYYSCNLDKASEGANIWYDDHSMVLYRSILQFRASGDYSLLPDTQLNDQYFPKDVPGWEKPHRIIDCGAYNGDTLLDINTKYGRIDAIAAFEPNIDNYRELCRQCHNPAITLAEEIYLFPCGVWSITQQLRFSSGKGEGSNISLDGDTVIQCVSLDEALRNFRPTFIKMDVEGAEYEALTGAKGIISRAHPQLAICLYHKPDDLWKIPLLIKQWDLGYKFYLRLQKYNGFELVLYAI